MYIKELEGGEGLEIVENERPEKAAKKEEEVKKELSGGVKLSCDSGDILVWDTKRVLVGAGARALFYPTLLYNVVRNKIQAEFRWWDWVDEFVLLGAVPFRSDVHRLKALGVGGVVTLNEPYETLVPSSLYHDNDICHLVLPTRDYLFAPSVNDISQAVDFIHANASRGRSTYVHCKAGRGRSTTVVICYLVKYKHMMPDAAYRYVKSIRPRVLLASAQWQVRVKSLSRPPPPLPTTGPSLYSYLGLTLFSFYLERLFLEHFFDMAVQDFYQLQMKISCSMNHPTSLIPRSPSLLAARDLLTFDDCSVVVITQADLDGYDPSSACGASGDEVWTNLGLIYRVRVARESALSRLSCLWLRCHSREKVTAQELTRGNSCLMGAKQLGRFTVNIHVYS